MAQNSDATNDDEDWARHLTPKLRKHFERTGRYLVEQQVLNNRYKAVEKRKAGMVWLGEKIRNDRRWEIFTVSLSPLMALAGAVLGALIGYYGSVQLQDRQEAQERQALVQVLIGEVEALKDEETERHDNLQPILKRLKEKNFDQQGARPWLLAPVPLRFPVFEENAGRLGLLHTPSPEKIARFCGSSYAPRSQVNVVTSPPIIGANTYDKIFVIYEYERWFKSWDQQAREIISDLNSCCG